MFEFLIANVTLNTWLFPVCAHVSFHERRADSDAAYAASVQHSPCENRHDAHRTYVAGLRTTTLLITDAASLWQIVVVYAHLMCRMYLSAAGAASDFTSSTTIWFEITRDVRCLFICHFVFNVHFLYMWDTSSSAVINW